VAGDLEVLHDRARAHEESRPRGQADPLERGGVVEGAALGAVAVVLQAHVQVVVAQLGGRAVILLDGLRLGVVVLVLVLVGGVLVVVRVVVVLVVIVGVVVSFVVESVSSVLERVTVEEATEFLSRGRADSRRRGMGTRSGTVDNPRIVAFIPQDHRTDDLVCPHLVRTRRRAAANLPSGASPALLTSELGLLWRS